MPESVGNTGLAGNHAVKCCRAVSSDFEAIRLKIRLNFAAARNVSVHKCAHFSLRGQVYFPSAFIPNKFFLKEDEFCCMIIKTINILAKLSQQKGTELKGNNNEEKYKARGDIFHDQ